MQNILANFDMCSSFQISRNLGVFASQKMCYILENNPSTLENFSTACIILSSANIKSFT